MPCCENSTVTFEFVSAATVTGARPSFVSMPKETKALSAVVCEKSKSSETPVVDKCSPFE